ncbi:MAG: S41 family peptidase [bacterium]|nr:S41 family peptidase [bacterium]
MVKRSGRRKLWIVTALVGILAVYITLDSRLVNGEDGYASVSRGIDEYAEALKLLTTSYYKPLEADSLTSAAIEGMLEDLDPYTQFLGRRAYQELMIDTRGKFGGLGITISMRGGDVPVVLSVIEDTPADTSGLVVGDQIVKINGEKTSGKTLEEVVDVLRGEPGKGVIITIERPGRTATFDQPIVRDRIGVRSVRSVAEIEPGVGYVSMSGLINSRFAETTPAELEEAIQEMKARNVKGIILDLRGNPGGLLSQAVAVADKFLDPGKTVVTTRGRVPSQNKDFETEEPSAVRDLPLVVLVNGHSASASEIVAGAIQDSDRGLILGTQTFGKGSVQSFRQIGQDKALKWTTALYYTPSGRSIHKASQRIHRSTGPLLQVGDKTLSAYQVVSIIGGSERRADAISELVERFDLDVEAAERLVDMDLGQMVGLGLRSQEGEAEGDAKTEKFKTEGGRTVYGGGGITPDVKVEPERRPRLVMAIGRAGLFFDFAVHSAVRRTYPKSPDGFDVGEDIMAEFRTFVADSVNADKLRYRTPAKDRFLELELALKEAGLGGEAEQASLKNLRALVEKEWDKEYEEALPFIRQELERALANRLWGSQGYLLASLKGDKQLEEAVRILQDPEKYKQSMKIALAK